MIYFIEHKTLEIIEIDVIENLDERLATLKLQGIDADVLGFIEQSTRLDEIRNQFSSLQRPNQINLFRKDATLEDYIEDHALTYDTALSESERYKTSYATLRKQQSFTHALDLHMNLVVHIPAFKDSSSYQPYLYFDLHSGPGRSPEGDEGSPLIFQNLANKYTQAYPHFNYHARFYEAEPHNYIQLKKNLNDSPSIEIIRNDHRTELPKLLERYQKSKTKNYGYGVVYADPSNANLPWELLQEMKRLFPRVDIMINIACASYKRNISSDDYYTLAERLPKVKKYWIIRKPVGKHQWSILVGTNWDSYPDWKKKEFYKWDDGDIGSDYFSRIAYTKNQRRDQRQPRLFSD